MEWDGWMSTNGTGLYAKCNDIFHGSNSTCSGYSLKISYHVIGMKTYKSEITITECASEYVAIIVISSTVNGK